MLLFVTVMKEICIIYHQHAIHFLHMGLWMHQFYKFRKDNHMILGILYFCSITVTIFMFRANKKENYYFTVTLTQWFGA